MLVEVWEDSIDFYAPTTDPRVCHGVPSSRFAAYRVDLDGNIRQSPGHPPAAEGAVDFVDVVGDEGRALARAAMGVWDAHPVRDRFVTAGRRTRLRERLEELDRGVGHLEAMVSQAQAHLDDARGARDEVRRRLLELG